MNHFVSQTCEYGNPELWYNVYMLTCVCLISIGSIKFYVLCSACQILLERLVLVCQCEVNIYRIL
jgi:hypothetical protein